MNKDTPFHVWMNVAVDEMQQAMVTLPPPAPSQRVHLFRCFEALVKVMEEVIKAREPNDHALS